MSNLYSQGFMNKDKGMTIGAFLDDSEYFVVIEARKIESVAPNLYNNEHYTEPRLLNSKMDIVNKVLVSKLRQEIKGLEVDETKKEEIGQETARIIAKVLWKLTEYKEEALPNSINKNKDVWPEESSGGAGREQ